MEKINSRKNTKCIHVKNLSKDRGYRTEHNQFVCDGRKMLAEAINSKAQIEYILAAAKPDIDLPENIPVYEVSNDVLHSISPLKNPQDILFVCRIPEVMPADYSTGIHILLDNVQDPGNIGTVLRSADAFGIGSIILTNGCADPYNPKSIRSSMGAVFRVNLRFADIPQLQNIKTRFIATANNNGYTPVNEADLSDAIIVLGNEGQGISKEIQALCSDMITIPVHSACESLNIAAAASIIMWEARKLYNVKK